MHPLSFVFLVVVTACHAAEIGLVLLHIRKACEHHVRGRPALALVQHVGVACMPTLALLALLPLSIPLVQAAGIIWALIILVVWHRRPTPEQSKLQKRGMTLPIDFVAKPLRTRVEADVQRRGAAGVGGALTVLEHALPQ